MRSSGIRNVVVLGGMITILGLTLYYYTTGESNWSGNTLRAARGNITVGRVQHNSSLSDIFFLETGGHGIITARMACAVESASKMHPNWTVHLLSVGGDGHGRNDSTRRFVNLLATFQNVVLSDIKPIEEFERTPLHTWYKLGVLNSSSYPVVHLADALRLAVLYTRGGVYLDIDVVVLRPLDSLGSFVSQSPAKGGDMVSNGFLAFHRGDPFLLELMKQASEVYEPDKWNSIGPLLLRNVTLAYCDQQRVKELVGHRCGGDEGFTALDHRKFLPLHYDESEMFFSANASKKAWRMSKGSYVMHVYGKMTSKMLTEPGSAYRQAAEAYCPESLRLSLDFDGTF